MPSNREEDFQEIRLLGKGGYANVYLVEESNTRNLYALKKIPKTKLQKRQHHERVKAEKTILESIRSPFLCRSFGVFDNETHHSFLLEYIEGELLYKCIWSHREGGKFSEEIARFFAVQIVLGVRTLHANGFLHRDLKTGNVIVNKKGFAKIIDFGFAKKLGPSIDSSSSLSTCNRTTSFCGTHYIMAPEIYLRQSYSFEVDWWSVGVMVYEMVAGRSAWEYSSDSFPSIEKYFELITQFTKEKLQKDSFLPCSSELKDLLRGLLNFDPSKRLTGEQIMHHPWFDGVDWDLFKQIETSEQEIQVPYNPTIDRNNQINQAQAQVIRFPLVAQGLPPITSSSSAESIDPKDNAKFFADF